MKKLIFIVIALSFTFVSYAQFPVTITDDIEGAETVNFTTINATNDYKSLSLDVLCTEVGGTSDGTLIVQGRNGSSGNWTTLTTAFLAHSLEVTPNDTLTITDAGVWKVVIKEPSFSQYRVQGAGTSGDTTTIAIKYLLK
jgi:hypothetical protein